MELVMVDTDALRILSKAKDAVVLDILQLGRHRERWIRGECDVHADIVMGHSLVEMLEAWRTVSSAWEHVLTAYQRG